jgi:hypothetical protein
MTKMWDEDYFNEEVRTFSLACQPFDCTIFSERRSIGK